MKLFPAVTSLFVLGLLAGTAGATTSVLVHGRNAGTPSSTEACEYWGACACVGNNAAGYDRSGYCGYAGGSTTTRARATPVQYDAGRAWWADATTADPICDVALEIKALADTDIRVTAHSAGNLVTLGLLTDAANGWGAGCGAGVVTAAANKITRVLAVQAPFSGAKAADAVYGHLQNSGNILTDWLHNLCGNTIGGLANIFADQASSMTYALQTSVAVNNRSYLSNSNTKPVYIVHGTGTSGSDSTWLAAGAMCTGGNYNDGLVEAYSARACTNTDAALTGTCTGKPANFTDYARAKIGHSSGRRGDYATTTDLWYSGMTSAHSHGMADLGYNHSPI